MRPNWSASNLLALAKGASKLVFPDHDWIGPAIDVIAAIGAIAGGNTVETVPPGPADAVRNEHLSDVTCMAIVGVVRNYAVSTVSPVGFDVLADRIQNHWSLFRAEGFLPEIKESKLTEVLAGDLSALHAARPISAAQWKAFLNVVASEVGSNENHELLAELDLEPLSETLEADFVAALFSAITSGIGPADQAGKKLTILKLNQIEERISELTGLSQKTYDAVTALGSPTRSDITPLPISDWTKGAARFRPRAKPVEYVGDPTLVNLFAEWVRTGPKGLRWAILGAAAGSGKTRFGLELIATLQAWNLRSPPAVDAFVLEPGDETNWAAWQVNRPTLIVIDYPTMRPDKFEHALIGLARRIELAHPVRVLLLDRDASLVSLFARLDALGTDVKACLKPLLYDPPKPSKAPGQIGQVTTEIEVPWPTFKLPPYKGHELALIVRMAAARFGQKDDPEKAKLVAKQLINTRATGRPLFALYAGAMLDTLDVSQLLAGDSIQLILSTQLLDEEIRHWKSRDVPDPWLGPLFASTVGGGIPGSRFQELDGLSNLDSPVELADKIVGWAEYAGQRLGPIEPDALGEVFCGLRFVGKLATQGQPEREPYQPAKTQSEQILGLLATDKQRQAKVRQFLTRLLQNFPALAENFRTEATTLGVWPGAEAVAAAASSSGDMTATEHAVASAGGSGMQARLLYALGMADPYRTDWLALAGRIEALVDSEGRAAHVQEPEVRSALAKALYNATMGEPGAGKRACLAGRIEALVDSEGRAAHVQEPEVRLQLARALFNATVGEPDAGKRAVLADWIEGLVDSDGRAAHVHEPEVRLQLAKALMNATAVDQDAGKCVALADRIEALVDSGGRAAHVQEPEVRSRLAKALCNGTAVGTDAGERVALAGRIEALVDSEGRAAHVQEPEVRLELAKALYNATVGEPDPSRQVSLADRIEALIDSEGRAAHRQEPEVRLALADALCNATVDETEAGKCAALARRIAALVDGEGRAAHAQEPEVRLVLAKALYNATSGEPDAVKCVALADRIEALVDSQGRAAHGQEPEMRLQLAKALYNAAAVEPDPEKCVALAGRIEALVDSEGRAAHVQEPEVRLELARALYNATARAFMANHPASEAVFTRMERTCLACTGLAEFWTDFAPALRQMYATIGRDWPFGDPPPDLT